jgi:hypothetical protein
LSAGEFFIAGKQFPQAAQALQRARAAPNNNGSSRFRVGDFGLGFHG